MKKNVAVIFGGQSTEHDISIITAISSIINPLKLTQKYNVIPIYIAKNGKWYSDKRLEDIKLYSSGEIEEFCQNNKAISLKIGSGMEIIKPGVRLKKAKIDIVFPAMHGTYGEDGSLAGLFRMAGVPFVGCDMSASVIAMDKVLAKQAIQANNINTAKYEAFSKNDYTQKKTEIIAKVKKLRLPVFVKPAHLGSSIGITKVAKFEDVENAIEVALHYDNKALVEEGVNNLIEVTVPIIGNDMDVEVALVERPLASDDFFDFETKYLSGNGKKSASKSQRGAQGYSELPANINKNLYKDAVAMAKRAYSITGCEGIARIDLLIDSEAGKVYFNEINPLPGSLYTHNWRAAGISGVELVEKLINFAESSFSQRKQLELTFKTNFLQQN